MYAKNPDMTASRQPMRGWMRRSLISTLVAVPALVTMVACSGAAPAPPNVSTASTQVAAGATLVASPVATAAAGAAPAIATVQAAASPALGTAQAAASPAMATAAAIMASPSPSPAAQSGMGTLRIADASLADATPWLSIQNDSDEAVEVGGWQLQVGNATAELPESAIVQPGSSLTLHAGTGLSSDDELFLGNAGDALAAAAMPGAQVRLTDDDGRIVSEVTVPRF